MSLCASTPLRLHAALIDLVAELGIVLLLFTLGIEFSVDRVWRIERAIFVGGRPQLGAP